MLLKKIELDANVSGVRLIRGMPVPLRDLMIQPTSTLKPPQPPIEYHHIYPMATYVCLPGENDYYLVIMVTEAGLQFSLAALRDLDGQRSLTVQHNIEIVAPTFYEDENSENSLTSDKSVPCFHQVCIMHLTLLLCPH